MSSSLRISHVLPIVATITFPMLQFNPLITNSEEEKYLYVIYCKTWFWNQMCTLEWKYFATRPSNEQHDPSWHHWGRTWKCHHNFCQTFIIKHMISLKAILKWKYLWKHIHGKRFGEAKQQLNLDNLKKKLKHCWNLELANNIQARGNKKKKGKSVGMQVEKSKP